MRVLTSETSLITRSEAGLRTPRSRTGLNPVYGSTVHYNGPPIGISRLLSNHSACYSTWRGIQAFHMGPSRGWSDIAYSVGVCPHGYAFEGRWVRTRTAANGTNQGNNTAYAIFAFLGDGEQPTEAMKRGIRDCAEYLRRQGGAGTGVNSHRNWKATACPGNPLAAWVASGAPRPVSAPTTEFPLKLGDNNLTTLVLEILMVHGGRDEIIVDGRFGVVTKAVLHDFQRLLKLGQRDIVRPQDFEAIRNWVNFASDPKTRPLTLTDRGPRVQKLREWLNLGPGRYDPEVQDKVKDLQRYFGGRPTGNATQETLRFIRTLANA